MEQSTIDFLLMGQLPIKFLSRFARTELPRTNDLIRHEVSWLTAMQKTKWQWNDAELERDCVPNWLSELGLLFWCAYPMLELNVRVTDINYFSLWSNQNAELPTYLLHIFQNMIMQHYERIFLAQSVGQPLLLGGCQCNTIEWICCLSSFQKCAQLAHTPLGSKPSTLSDFAQMFKEK